MRRLVAISNRTSNAIMALAASTIALTSIHLAAAAKTASLQREQQRLESATINTRLAPTVPVEMATAHASVPMVPKRHLLISIVDRKLAVMDDSQVVKIYPIAVGSSHSPSPDGDFVIINHARDPVYRHDHQEVPPGKDNPLGTRWMGLSLKGYGIHGTNVQTSVGKAVSHGCFRMRRTDVEELYTQVRVGDAVTVRRERDEMVARVFADKTPAPATVESKTQSNDEKQLASATPAAVETAHQ